MILYCIYFTLGKIKKKCKNDFGNIKLFIYLAKDKCVTNN